jgi:hypothetical protein
MTDLAPAVDTVRASRDGHEFHEAWTARKAMQLLLPTSELAGIAVEGLEPAAQSVASAETVEIADITVYNGRGASFQLANSVEIIQFKYSVSKSNTELRASDAKKTVTKFADAYRDHKANYADQAVTDKLSFELITNRPVYRDLQTAIAGIASGKRLTGQPREQGKQFKKAAGLTGNDLKKFASKCAITGLSGSLTATKRDLTRILIDWSATPYALATSRIGKIRQLVRDKAGSTGTNRNVIRRVDLLEALDINDIDELLPCPASLPKIGEIVPREQLPDAIAIVPGLNRPFLVHGDGGIGKTVFLDSLSAALSEQHEVVFFDCFGSGRYRTVEDARHLPNRGLVHIANTLACRGLCDPLLPGSDSMETLFTVFRKRLEQCVAALAKASPNRMLLIFIDAIDNAAEHAKDKHQPSFPTLLLESLEHSPIANLRLIVSCRSYRRAISVRDVACEDFHLKAFTPAESESYVRARVSDVTSSEIQVAHARSQGNARILEHLATSDRGLLDPSEIENPILLNDLIRDRIEASLSEAVRRGSKRADIDAFLAGLSVLPPPVPLDEYAGAHNLDVSAIQSFAADLAPLLEQTNQGLMFRDEPTETLVRERYGSDAAALRRVARNLFTRQDQSVYAARALPGLLQKLNDGRKLFALAFDERFPATITGTVGRRRIRYARLQAAVRHAATTEDSNRLVRLLVELSTIAAVEQKGANYILDNPDLAVVAQDDDALRRLFETRTKWPGARHARLAIANVLSGDIDDAYRHQKGAEEWILHKLNQPDREREFNKPGPERLDHASLPVFLVSQRQSDRAIRYMRIWHDWYAFELCEHALGLIRLAEALPDQSPDLDGFVTNLTTEIGCIAGAVSFLELPEAERRCLIEQLAKACNRATKLQFSERYSRERPYELPDGLRKAAAIAVSLGLGQQALKISLRAPHERPRVWSLQDQHSDGRVLPFLFRVALESAVKGTALHERDILPAELIPLSKGLSRSIPGYDFRKKLKAKLEKQFQKQRDKEDEQEKQISAELKASADRFIDKRLVPILELTRAFAGLLAAPQRQADHPFRELINAWVKVRALREGYSTQKFNHFFQLLGSNMAIFALWARSDLKSASVRLFLQRLHEQPLGPWVLNRVVTILARRSRMQNLAGEQAVKSKVLIDQEDDVNMRASLYAELARAILPASQPDATAYFKAGLEQMDAIGSGDYDFANELLLFAASMKGSEISEKDFHTLTNVSELNLTYEEHKFPWASFGAGLAKAAGWQALPKLCRWHDRSKIALEYTLLPYLTALVRDEKISPRDAVALNWLAEPAELWSCNTESFAHAIYEKRSEDGRALVAELIRQFEANNSGIATESTTKALATIAADVLGKNNTTARYLNAAHKRFGSVIDELNQQRNYRQNADERLGNLPDQQGRDIKSVVQRLADRTDPLDDESLTVVIGELKDLNVSRELEGFFFDRVRSKVTFGQQSIYVRLVATLENLDSYAKFRELTACKDVWACGSAALTTTYAQLAVPIIHIHAEEFLSFDHLSTYQLKELSDLTGVAIPALSIELVKLFAGREWVVPAAAWLGLASITCGQANEGEGQKALSRLLNSSAAQLTSTVTDGAWKRGLYPSGNFTAIASGILWLMLGSPSAADRWRAAHAVRCFARFARWEIVDALVARFPSKDAKGFQAPELSFYYLHARLWLLIALARIALDEPQQIGKHKALFLRIALEDRPRHPVIAHFAARAILTCVDAGALTLPKAKLNSLRAADQSPFPPLDKRLKDGAHGAFYRGRPKDTPKPKHKFSLDYDFEKYDVHNLSDVFGQPGWKVKDMIAAEAHVLDASVATMYESGGREVPNSRRGIGLDSQYHGYGQYLAWHALIRVAGRLLEKYPVTNDWHYGEPWTEWLHRRCVTRKDGLWLSDGMDRPPLTTKINLLEMRKDGLALTGDKQLLKRLAGIEDTTITDDIVIHGRWKSPDDIDVYICSALVQPRKAKRLAKQLMDEEPFSAWLPTYHGYEDEEEHLRGEKKEYEPWIVSLEAEGALDGDDPLAVIDVERRPRLVANLIKTHSLRAADPFTRLWRTAHRKKAATSDAWGHESRYEGRSHSGVRLNCSPHLLARVLSGKNRELLLLITLQRYEERAPGVSDSRFSNTVAVVRIKGDLSYQYIAGPANHVHTSGF